MSTSEPTGTPSAPPQPSDTKRDNRKAPLGSLLFSPPFPCGAMPFGDSLPPPDKEARE